MAFVSRRMRRWQLHDRGPRETGGVFTGYVEDFFVPGMTRMVADRSSKQAGPPGGVDEAGF
jgi:hypothetical protein